MDSSLVIAAMSTPSGVLRYAAAFFFVVVAIGIAYACYKAGKTLERVDKVLGDVDQEAMPLMRKAGVTLDGVNANLGNVDGITKDVAGITDKIDKLANSMESAVSAPARKAAAFSAGVQSAVSGFVRRTRTGSASSGSAGGSAPQPEGSEAPAESAADEAAAGVAGGGAAAPGWPGDQGAEAPSDAPDGV